MAFALDPIERGIEFQRLGGDRTAMVLVQRMELAPRMRHAADFGRALAEQRVIALVVIADE